MSNSSAHPDSDHSCRNPRQSVNLEPVRPCPRWLSYPEFILRTAIRWLIWIYQRILNPMLKAIAGPCTGCRYTPTCSNYFLQAVELHGAFRGSWYGICRIFRCHPWGGSGYDPVPSPPTHPVPHGCRDHDLHS